MKYLIVLCLAGCATGPTQQEIDAANAARAQAYRDALFRQCASYGYTAGTDQFRQCLMQADIAKRQANDAGTNMLLQQYIQQRRVFR